MEQIDKEKMLAELKAKREIDRIEREKRIREYWETLKPFTDVNDLQHYPELKLMNGRTFMYQN